MFFALIALPAICGIVSTVARRAARPQENGLEQLKAAIDIRNQPTGVMPPRLATLDEASLIASSRDADAVRAANRVAELRFAVAAQVDPNFAALAAMTVALNEA